MLSNSNNRNTYFITGEESLIGQYYLYSREFTRYVNQLKSILGIRKS